MKSADLKCLIGESDPMTLIADPVRGILSRLGHDVLDELADGRERIKELEAENERLREASLKNFQNQEGAAENSDVRGSRVVLDGVEHIGRLGKALTLGAALREALGEQDEG